MRPWVCLISVFWAVACAPPVVPGDAPGTFAGDPGGASGARTNPSTDRAGGAAGAAASGAASVGQPDAAAPRSTPPSAPDGAASTPDAPLLSLGAACAEGAQCASSFCTHGVCCDQSCDTACFTCAGAQNPGTCTPAAAGEDPHDSCPQDPPETCRRDGTCDGAGACRNYAVGTQCAAGGCANATEQAASTCSSQGTCEKGASRSCAPNVCQGDSCAAACADDAACLTGFHCDGGVCRINRALGSECAAGTQCASGFCAGGVCCASACTKTCYSCAVAGSVGSCVPVPAGQDPASQCPPSSPSTCGRAGGCNGAGACQLHPAGTQCGAPSCADSSAVSAATCDGLGRCAPGDTRSCGAYRCEGNACRSRCTSSNDCREGFACSGGSCLPANKVDNLVVHDQANAAGWSLEENFQIGPDGAHPWTDYPATFVASLPSEAENLLGKAWIRVVSDSKNFDDGPQATLTLNRPADVYILVDARWEEPRPWTAGFTDTGLDFRIRESSARPNLAFRLFRRSAGVGAFALAPIGANRAYNYFVIVD